MVALGAMRGEPLRNDTESRMAVFIEVSVKDVPSAAVLAVDFRYGWPAARERLGCLPSAKKLSMARVSAAAKRSRQPQAPARMTVNGTASGWWQFGQECRYQTPSICQPSKNGGRVVLGCKSVAESTILRWHQMFDMSGGAKDAQRPLGRPLDEGVRPRRDTALPLLKEEWIQERHGHHHASDFEDT